jgi:hypothetical protein
MEYRYLQRSIAMEHIIKISKWKKYEIIAKLLTIICLSV